MFLVKEIKNPDDKEKISLDIMKSLSKWFNPPEDIDKKAVIHRDYPFFGVFQEAEIIGFIALKIHNEYTMEIYNMGVLEAFHRNGIGHLLVESVVTYGKEHNYQYLTVKTLDSSAKYEPYEKTRAFYLKEGFIPLEVFTTFWNEENPCLFLIKNICT